MPYSQAPQFRDTWVFGPFRLFTKDDMFDAMADQAQEPATKGDLKSLEARLGGKIDSLDQKLDASVQRLAKDNIKTHDRIDKMEERLRQDMRQLNSDVTTKMESFTSRTEALWRESAVLPRAVDEHAEKLRDHELRLKGIEASQRR